MDSNTKATKNTQSVRLHFPVTFSSQIVQGEVSKPSSRPEPQHVHNHHLCKHSSGAYQG